MSKTSETAEIDPIVAVLTEARTRAGVQAKDLADDLGFSQSHLSNIENGRADLRLSQAHAWASIFDMSIEVNLERKSLAKASTPATDGDRSAVMLTPFQTALASGMLLSLARDYRHSGKSERLADDLEAIADALVESMGR